MFIVHVHVHVKPECVEAFEAATLENATNSVQEPGIARFDVNRQLDDATRGAGFDVVPDQEEILQQNEKARDEVIDHGPGVNSLRIWPWPPLQLWDESPSTPRPASIPSSSPRRSCHRTPDPGRVVGRWTFS